MLSLITQEYTPESVFMVFLTTLGGFIGLSYYAVTTKNDITIWLSMLFGMSFLLLFLSISMFFIPSATTYFWVSLLTGGLAMIFAVVDTQMIL